MSGLGMRIGLRRFVQNWAMLNLALKLYNTYFDRVTADSGTINNVTITQDAYKNLPQIDSIKFGWMGGAGSKKRTSTIYSYFTKLYTIINPTPVYGAETIPSLAGSFDTWNGWQVSAGWTISGGKGIGSAVFGSLRRYNAWTPGKYYKITITVVRTAGSINFYDFENSPSITTSGTYTFHLKKGYNTSDFFITGAGFTGTVDDVSVQEVINSIYTVTDAANTTEDSQPRVTGNIAPTDTEALQNVEGSARFITHPAISFAANEAWSLSWYGIWNGSANAVSALLGKGSDTLSNIVLRTGSANTLAFYNESGGTASGTAGATAELIGKRKWIYIEAIGNGTLKVYFDNVLKSTLTVATNFVFANLFKGQSTAGREYFGTLTGAIVRSGNLLEAERTSEFLYLRTKYPEIPQVTIGSQTWALRNCDMVATSQGNVIANVTDNAAWAASQTTYDNVYAATSGTVEQKTYAAVKAAAMWCFYNNSADNGAIYGKLYNWFAVKLLQMDIDYYNAANPATPWGWRVPTSTDFTTLQTALGGASVAGGKMKMTGLNYWLTPNTGADNSSGFTALGGGQRFFTNGASIDIKAYSLLWAIIKYSSTNAYSLTLSNVSNTASVDSYDCRTGFGLRLIKTS